MTAPRHRFGPFELREDEHLLLRDGVEVPLQPAAFELLVFFVRRPGRLLSRDELLREAWSVHVSDQSLSQMVRRVRVALDDDSGTPVWLETVRGRGYRFRGPQEATPPSSPPSVFADGPTLMGREVELDALRQALTEHRLVTVLGPGGIGKTCLARRFASQWGERAWWCELQAVRDASGVVHALWSGRGLGGGAGSDPIGELAGILGSDLLVLDNVEQVLGEVRSLVERLLAEAPRARILLTSRARLGLAAERCLELGPLPDEQAIALLRERAEAVRLGLGRIEPAVASAIVSRLGGIPLALVLAAPGLLLMSASELRDRLAEPGLSLLGAGEATDRSASLSASIRWGYELLPIEAQRAAARCSVFRGPFGLEAAAAVLDLPDLVVSLTTLRDRSLLHEVSGPGPRRLAILEPVRAWLEARLAEDGALAEVRARHARYYAAAWEEEERADRHVAELEDLRAAWQNAPDPLTRARIAPVFAHAASERVGPGGLVRTLDEAVATAGDQGDDRLLAALLCQRGWIRGLELGQQQAAQEDLRLARDLGRSVGAARIEARALSHLGVVTQYSGQVRDSLAIQAEAVALCRAAAWPWGLVRALAGLGHALWKGGDVEPALTVLREAVDLAAEHGVDRWHAFALCQLADIAYARGDIATHDLLSRDLQRLASSSEDRKGRRWADELASRNALAHGRFDEAEHHAQSALQASAGSARRGALMRLVNALLARGELHGALPILAEAEVLARKTAQRDHLGWVLEVRCALDAALGEFARARERAEELRGLVEGADPSDRVQVDSQLVLYALLAGEVPAPLPAQDGAGLRDAARRVLALAQVAQARAEGRRSPVAEREAAPRAGEPPFIALLRQAVEGVGVALRRPTS